MQFNQVAINLDPLYVPVCDRWLPNHPKELYGNLPYWYWRSRFEMYGLADFDLPLRGIRKKPEFNERLWHQVSRYKGMEIQEKFWMIGALLPYHWMFDTMHASLEVEGEKVDNTQPWAFRYID